jgi:hypothetical protein
VAARNGAVRTPPLPAAAIAPTTSRSPDCSRRGVRPKCCPTLPDGRNRAGRARRAGRS